MQVSQHFSLDEFACHDGTPYPSEWISTRLPALVKILEAIRAAVDAKIHIMCGFRTAEENQRLRLKGLRGEGHMTGVAKHSQHMEGRAADIQAFGVPVKVLYSDIMRLYEEGKLPDLGGVALYEGLGFVHVDSYRMADGHLRRWFG